jgi:cytochrome c biogenesis protein CcdA
MIAEYIINSLKHISAVTPIVVLLAGVAASLTPCNISTVPLIVGYVRLGSLDSKSAFKVSIVYAVGNAITYTLLGYVVIYLRHFVKVSNNMWNIFLGILMIALALQILEIVEVLPNVYLHKNVKSSGYTGALIIGLLTGIFGSPCSTPILIAVIALISNIEDIWYGLLLLFLFSIGRGALAVISGTSIGVANKLTKMGKLGQIVQYTLGVVVLSIGVYLIYTST